MGCAIEMHGTGVLVVLDVLLNGGIGDLGKVDQRRWGG